MPPVLEYDEAVLFLKQELHFWPWDGRVTLKARGLGSSSIVNPHAALRTLAVAATDNGLLAPELAAGIARVKSAKSALSRHGLRVRRSAQRVSWCFRSSTRAIVEVELVSTSPHYGGLRWWFICPVTVGGRACQRRVRKLYLPPGGRSFACRRCCQLSYTSQRQDDMNRALSKAQAIRERLGGSASMAQPFPSKPKKMWWRTYRRLRASSEELWMACLLGGSDGTRLIGTNIYATALACARPPSTPPGRRRRAWKSRTPANRSSRPRRGTPRPRPSALAFSAPSGRWCDDVGNCAKSAVRHLQPPPFRVTFCN